MASSCPSRECMCIGEAKRPLARSSSFKARGPHEDCWPEGVRHVRLAGTVCSTCKASQGEGLQHVAVLRHAAAAPGPEASPAFGARQVACRIAIQERLQRSFWETSRLSGTPAFRDAQPAQHAALRELLHPLRLACGLSHHAAPEEGEKYCSPHARRLR